MTLKSGLLNTSGLSNGSLDLHSIYGYRRFSGPLGGVIYTPLPTPPDIGQTHMWLSELGWDDDGTVATWTDQVSGVVMSNTDIGLTDLGKPDRVNGGSTGFHGERPTIAFDNGQLANTNFPGAALTVGEKITYIICGSGEGVGFQIYRGADLNRTVAQSNVGIAYTNSQASIFFGNKASSRTDSERIGEYLLEVEFPENGNATTLNVYEDGNLLTAIVNTAGVRAHNSMNPLLLFGGLPSVVDGAITNYGINVEAVFIFKNKNLTAQDRIDIVAWWEARKAIVAQYSGGFKNYSVALAVGQSNVCGQGSTGAITTFQPHGDIMFDGGFSSWIADAQSVPRPKTSTTPLKEFYWESGLVNGLSHITDHKIARNGWASWKYNPKHFFLSSGGRSGVNLGQISDGGLYWNFTRDDIEAVKALIASEGGTSTFDWIPFVHGYSNYGDSASVYKTKMDTLYSDILATAHGYAGAQPKVIIGQSATQVYTNSLPEIALGQNLFADTHAYGYIAAPLYCVDWGDAIHMDNAGHQMKGYYLALCMDAIAEGTWDGPVRFQLDSWDGATIELTILGGNGTYAFDATYIPQVLNEGFDVYNGATLISDAITNVSIIGRSVTLTVGASAAAGTSVTYGFGRTGWTHTAGTPIPLGNLRDTMGEVVTIPGDTITLHNYAIIQQVLKP